MREIKRPVLTTSQAAHLAGVAPRTIAAAFDRGELQGFRIPGGGHRRIDRQSLEEWLNRNRPQPSEAPDRKAEAKAFREDFVAVNISRPLWERLKAFTLKLNASTCGDSNQEKRAVRDELELAVKMHLEGQEEEYGCVPESKE